MFVDVEFPVDLPATLVVPADAIVDSGLRKTVFVDRGNGYFEPRLVETGWRIGDDVEVTKGLMPGERIVISGTFFVDSESRMKAATRTASAAPVLDPVCGMHVDPSEARQRRPHGGARRARVLLLLGQLQAAVRRRPVAPREADGREAMIERIIDFSVRNKFLVLLLVGAAALAGARALRNVPLDAIPDLGDTQVIVYSRWDRSPDLIEAQVTYPIVTAHAWRAARASGPRRLRFWLLVRLRDLRGRHRHLLGAHADAGVPLGRAVAAAARCADGARARRDRSRLGVPVRARGPIRQTQPGGSAVVSGLVPALLPEGGARRVGGGLGRRLRPAVPGERRPEPAAQLRPLDPARRRGGARRQRRDWRPADRVRRHRVHGARPRLREVGRRLREHRRVRQRERHADPDPRHRPRDGRPGSAAGRGGSGRRRRSGVGDRRDAPGRERGRRDRSRQGAHPPDRAGLAVRDGDRPDLRPLGADPPRDRQRERDTRRGGAHRRLHRAAVPVARAERAHPAHHPSGCRARGVHPVPRAGDHGEHHVARRHRDRDGRAGGRGDRRRGTDPQEARAGAARRIDARLSRGRPRGGQGGGAGELLRAARDRGVVPPGADARVAGRAAVQAAGLHQDAHDARGGGPRDHARPRAARALHARAALRVPARVALPGDQRGARRPHPLRGVASDQPLPHADLRAGRPLVAAVEVVGDRRRRGARRRHRAGVHAPRIGVHAAAATRGRCSTCRRRCPASRSARRRSWCR